MLIEKNYDLYICPGIYQEILQGIRDDTVFGEIKNILMSFPTAQAGTMEASDCAAGLYRTLRKKNIIIKNPLTCLTAAYAILDDMYLFHRNRDFLDIASAGKLKLFK
ncbi:hypothetical protein K7I13_11605 [Brucepastera parasyntrophica]|uniref:hypothetical protein n=1 Tax=Brucepastera parasyntrophica TaxID=2880008 RepID=UPI00210BC842|nr:hypothetical protein [Brucepastera parasyntrophica]ULQ59139.1 hypothetical protein K7I13_11605 [Brucepastera parasyntrophica]